MKAVKYWIAYSIPFAVGLSIYWGDERGFFAILYGFFILPAIEFFMPIASQNLSRELEEKLTHEKKYDWMLWVFVPIQYGLLFQFCSKMSELSRLTSPSTPSFSESLTSLPYEWFSSISLAQVAMVSALGLSCGVIGINIAHELGHRKSAWERGLARALLATSLNWQFYIEHNRGHHRFVGTPGDSETSRLNESVYAFWLRAFRDNLLSAIRRDPREMFLGFAVEAGLCLWIFFSFGKAALIGFIASAFIGILLLQSVNYIEHYGLTRKLLTSGAWEPISPQHSWNSSHPLSRIMLFELSRHSDHHAHATRKYQILRHLEDSPQMPYGYPAMILLAMIPPLWFRIMNPRIPT